LHRFHSFPGNSMSRVLRCVCAHVSTKSA